MSDRVVTRRQAIEAVTVLFSVTVLGCRDNGSEKPGRIGASVEETTVNRVPTPTLGWEVIASGNSGPGKRSRHGLIYDRSMKAAVLFGGVVWTPDWNLQADTWELHGREWTRIETSETPPARHRGAMAYLDNREQSLLFGGQGVTNDILGDTWTYSGRRWRRVRPAAVPPPPRCGHCMAFDEQAGVAVLFGGIDAKLNSLGDTWVFEGNSWKEVRSTTSPPARRYAALAYDADLKGCLLHGGSEDEAGHRSFGDAWLFQDNTWKRLGSHFDTDPRDDHGLGYHRGAKRMVMLEGIAATRGILVRESTGWQTVEANPLHPRHQCSPLAWDADLGGLLLHGGEAHHEGPQFDVTLLLRMPSAS
jgi:Galactose oxidase, central domain